MVAPRANRPVGQSTRERRSVLGLLTARFSRPPALDTLQRFLCIGYCASMSYSEIAVLRALASTMRRAILDHLGQGPATSAMLARALDSNTGVMSYHLREL